MPDRSLRAIDDELSLAVKARDAARGKISTLSGNVVSLTSKIDSLLAERSALAVVTCPDTPASLTAETRESA